jgi:ArsR family transcriptional regulator
MRAAVLRLRAGRRGDNREMLLTMSLVRIYQCLCDETRLRILHLLAQGELCVCHFQEILGEPQVKISKHLGYLKRNGLVESRKDANWVIYSLPLKPSRELSANLACLQDCVRDNVVFRKDEAKRAKSVSRFAATSPICCASARPKGKAKTECCE